MHGFYLTLVPPPRLFALVYGCLLFGMLSLLRPPTPVTLKLSSRTQQLTLHPPLGKHATFAQVLTDTGNSPACPATPFGCPLVAIGHLKENWPMPTDTQRLPLPIQPLPDVRGDTVNSDIANRDASPTLSHASHCSVTPGVHPLCSSFPVVGPFDLLHCIESGGFADAWAAKDRSTGRLLCLKAFLSVQKPHIMRSVQTELKMFRRMVKSKGGQRGKQFIVELNRSIQHDTTVFFAMELMTTDLGAYMSTEPERSKLHARRWTAQIALGIESLHEMGIIHRDIKPENVLIDSRENVRIIDFGLSYMNPSGKPLCPWGEYTIEFVGTQAYMAPEVLESKGLPVDRRSPCGPKVDWWALGCILFELESQDHLLLFDSEEDIYAYVEWTLGSCQSEEIYPSFGALDPIAVNLIEGLLQAQPSARYSLKDMETHAYFLRRDGTCELDNAAARALVRSIRPELVPRFEDHQPIKVIEAAKSSSIYDWTNLKSAQLVDG